MGTWEGLDPEAVYGIPVVAGLSYAPVAWASRPGMPPVGGQRLLAHEREAAAAQFEAAARQVSQDLSERAGRADGPAAEVLSMNATLAVDPGWMGAVRKCVMEGTPPAAAATTATDDFVRRFRQAGGALAEREADLVDIRDRVIAKLLGLPDPGIPSVDSPVVLFADDLSPADTTGLDPTKYVAIVTKAGGPTSHTSIIARQLGIPCIVGARDLDQIAQGTPVLVNGSDGSIRPSPDPTNAQQRVERYLRWKEKAASWTGPATTKDGVHVELLANVQDEKTAVSAADSPNEGVGLFRTELLFLGAKTEPSIEKQAQAYSAVFAAFRGRKVVVRTLDAGSDKPVPYASSGREPNPALGARGIRVGCQDDSLIQNQLDAIELARDANPDTEVWVMAPMVSVLAESQWFSKQCQKRNLKPGIMVEVPATAVLIERFFETTDFVSVGTNDLAQYTMAADRTAAHLSEYADHWQPAVLELIAKVAAAGQAADKPVGICGESAGDPVLACVLVGLGATSLSMAPPALPLVGARLREVTFDQCIEAGNAALDALDARAARAAARRALGLT